MSKRIMLLVILLAALNPLSASPANHKAMAHVNPMPNYMRIVMQNEAVLKLSEEQQSALADWRDSTHNTMQRLVRDIMEDEKELRELSLTGAHKAKIMNKMAQSLEKRRRIATIKTDCRDNMRSVLNAEQWQQVIELAK